MAIVEVAVNFVLAAVLAIGRRGKEGEDRPEF
jgi:hypothetical protein